MPSLINDFVCEYLPQHVLPLKILASPVEGEGGEGECCGNGSRLRWTSGAAIIFSGGGSCRGKGAVLTMPQLGYRLIGGS